METRCLTEIRKTVRHRGRYAWKEETSTSRYHDTSRRRTSAGSMTTDERPRFNVDEDAPPAEDVAPSSTVDSVEVAPVPPPATEPVLPPTFHRGPSTASMESVTMTTKRLATIRSQLARTTTTTGMSRESIRCVSSEYGRRLLRHRDVDAGADALVAPRLVRQTVGG